jgi:CelD/BcsL family acetyltransferase involved in cellulose biosynthesis
MAAAIARARRRLDLLLLPRAGTAAALAAAVPRTEARVVIRSVERSPWVSLDRTWEQFEAALPGKRRSDLRRRRRRLAEEVGEVECVSHDGSEGLASLLREGFEVEASGWKGERGTAVNAEPDARRFYENAAAWAADAGLLNLWFLRAGGRTVAFAYCITDAEAHHVLKIGIEPAYSRYAPGMLLTRQMLVDSFRRGLRRYEFLGQDDPYKLVWTDRIHERERLQVFPQGPLGAADSLAWRHGRPLVKRLLRR